MLLIELVSQGVVLLTVLILILILKLVSIFDLTILSFCNHRVEQLLLLWHPQRVEQILPAVFCSTEPIKKPLMRYVSMFSRSHSILIVVITVFCQGGMTALLAATYYSKEEVVKVLLESNVNTEAKDKVSKKEPLLHLFLTNYLLEQARGRTPLIWAAENGAVQIVEMLLNAHANIDATDNVK